MPLTITRTVTSIHISHEILQEPLQVLMWVIKLRRLVHLNPRCSRKSIFIGFDATRIAGPSQTLRIVPRKSKKNSQASIRMNAGLSVLAHLYPRLCKPHYAISGFSSFTARTSSSIVPT
jgi:hypothetical protein